MVLGMTFSGSPSRVLLVHNRYQQIGGEDAVFAAEAELLRRSGCEVETFEADNREANDMPAWKVAAESVWSETKCRSLRELLERFRPQIAHFHNTFFRISPAALLTCKKAGVPVVQTLHNFRLACVNALLFRENRPCEKCVGKTFAWPGLLHACYHGSRSHTAMVLATYGIHGMLGTYRRSVDAFIALSEFSRTRFLKHGLPEEKIHIKPNFLERDPGLGSHRGGFVLYAGRLSHEKGVGCLLRAWSSDPSLPALKIAGTGPEERALREVAGPQVEFLGHLDRERLHALMRDAALLVFPSEWYENFPVILLEAYAAGLPVVASNIGALPEIVDEGTGRLFDPGSPGSLAASVKALLASPQGLAMRGEEARRRFLARYTPDKNLDMLFEIYAAAAAASSRHRV
jgi:glycosyltransferase involved in cell wall biosynthesis